ncbi:MAG: diacylglycerol kinase family lipid kinase [Actinobacteria bacterium]|nr:diacylglycerol kinase family lipid kinase [Actinomycetota bacterium]
MGSPFGKAVVIANARAGKGSVSKDPSRYEDLLAAAGLDFEIRLTDRAGHAIDIADAALDEGIRYLIALGGDGTIHEVVNGMLHADGTPKNPDAVLGVLPAGSGSDFIRTFGLPQAAEDAAKHLAGENLFLIDVGRVEYQSGAERRSVFFPNIAEAGLGGDIVRRAERLPRWLGKSRYLFSFWMTLSRYKATQGRITMGDRVYEGKITNLVVANAQFFGGAMKIAPRAHPSDGMFDVLVQMGTKADYVAGITKVYKGDHIPSPAIKVYLAAKVEVTTDASLQVEADGEVLGYTPATFEIIPRVINLKI